MASTSGEGAQSPFAHVAREASAVGLLGRVPPRLGGGGGLPGLPSFSQKKDTSRICQQSRREMLDRTRPLSQNTTGQVRN